MSTCSVKDCGQALLPGFLNCAAHNALDFKPDYSATGCTCNPKIGGFAFGCPVHATHVKVKSGTT